MTRVLIAVLSCAADRELMLAQLNGCFAGEWPRKSRVSDLEADLRYFVGCPPALGAEVQVKCGDSYADLPFKTQGLCSYALVKGFDFLFKCDTDTLVHVPRLLEAVPECDYSGYYRGHPDEPSYASGGSGYWLSREAMDVVAWAQFETDYEVEDRGYVRGEDLQVGKCLAAAGILCLWDERYRLDEHLPHPGNEIIATHDVRVPLKGRAMRDAWRRVEKSFRGRL